jgi:hypothetical protein
MSRNRNQNNLSQEDLELLKEIQNAGVDELLKGKDSSGIPFLKHIFRLRFQLFGETCSGCPGKIFGYIQKIKKFNPHIMKKENSNTMFKLKDMVTIPVPGTSKAYSNHNITDEIAVELIAKNPNRKTLFSKLPDDLNERIEAYKASRFGSKQNVSKPYTKGQNDSPELVKIGEVGLSVDDALELLGKLGLSTRAKKADSIMTFIEKLPVDKKTEIFQAVTLGSDNKPKESTTAPENKLKNLEQLEFDLDSAKQEREDLSKKGASDDELVAIDEKIKAIEVKIEELGS